MKVLVVTDNMPSLTAGNVLEQIRLFQFLGHDVSVLAWRCDSALLTSDWQTTLDDLPLAYPPCTFNGSLVRFPRRLRSVITHPLCFLKALAVPHRESLTGTRRHLLNGYLSSQIEAYARNANADVCIANFGPNAEVALFLQILLRRRIPTVAYFRGYDMLPSIRGIPIEKAYRLTPRHAFPATNSEFSRQRLLSYALPFAHTINVIPNSVNCELFSPAKEQPRPHQGPLRLLSVGRVIRAKGLDTAIDALGLLRRKGIHADYTIVGTGPDRAELEARATELGVLDSVHFTGPLFGSALRQRFRAADIFLFLSRRTIDGGEETQGVALVQAQASGLAVIASRIGGIPENLDDGRSGCLVDEGVPERVAERLLWFEHHTTELLQFKLAARQFALRNRSTIGSISVLWSRYLKSLSQSTHVAKHGGPEWLTPSSPGC